MFLKEFCRLDKNVRKTRRKIWSKFKEIFEYLRRNWILYNVNRRIALELFFAVLSENISFFEKIG